MARRTFNVVDVTEIYVHWYAGRSKSELAASLYRHVDVRAHARYRRVTVASLDSRSPETCEFSTSLVPMSSRCRADVPQSLHAARRVTCGTSMDRGSQSEQRMAGRGPIDRHSAPALGATTSVAPEPINPFHRSLRRRARTTGEPGQMPAAAASTAPHRDHAPPTNRPLGSPAEPSREHAPVSPSLEAVAPPVTPPARTHGDHGGDGSRPPEPGAAGA